MIKRYRYINKIEEILSLNKAVFLVGGRQVGKTTLMKYFFQEYWGVFINFDEISGDIIKFDNLKNFLDYINFYYDTKLEDQEWIFFDEITRVKNFNVIFKAFKDKFPNKKVICSSSGNYDMINNIIEGLAGRAVKLEVFPLTFDEFLLFKWKKFSFSNVDENIFKLILPYILEYLTFGGYPEVVLTNWIEKKIIVLKSIIDSIFEKDLTFFVTKQEFPDLKKLISYIAENIGNPFSYEGLANILSIKTKRLKFYLDLLERSYILKFLPPFWTDKSIEYNKRSKLYILDFGILNFFLGRLSGLKQNISWKDCEMMVFLNLFFTRNFDEEIYFYRKINWTEIDFILKRWEKLIPIEAKLENKDNIPKVFIYFLEKYKDKVEFFVKTTTSLVFQRNIDWKKIYWIPFWMINFYGKIITDNLN